MPIIEQADRKEGRMRMQRLLHESGIFPNKGISRESIGNLISSICSDPILLQMISERSYNHDNGFSKLVVYVQDGYKIRIHIFSNGLSGVENFHNHRWPFSSFVIAGTLNFDVATVQENENGDFEQWSYRKDGDFFDLNQTGMYYDVDWESRSLKEGSEYRMEVETIHRITESIDYTATLAITEPTDSANCFQYNYRGSPVGQNGTSQKMPVLDAGQVKILLEDLLNSIGVA